MKLLKKIFAYFTIKGKKQQMELAAAEIKEKGVFLHPAADPKHTFFVKSDSVDIIINPEGELNEDDIFTIDRDTLKGKSKADKRSSTGEQDTIVRPLSTAFFMPKKRKFSIMVYQDEYDMLMENIVSKGYKKAEYFLACVTATKKQSWEKEYRSFTTSHKTRYKNDRLAAEQAVEEKLKKREIVEKR